MMELLKIDGTVVVTPNPFTGPLSDRLEGGRMEIAYTESVIAGGSDGKTSQGFPLDKAREYLEGIQKEFDDLYALNELQVAGVVKGLMRKY